MRITRVRTAEVEYTVDNLCNLCGESCSSGIKNARGTPVKWSPGIGLVEIDEEEALQLRGPDLYGLIDAKVSGGYFSKALSDGDTYEFSLCEPCVAKLIADFKIPAKTGNYLLAEETTEEEK